jgi:hypothetical protein
MLFIPHPEQSQALAFTMKVDEILTRKIIPTVNYPRGHACDSITILPFDLS